MVMSAILVHKTIYVDQELGPAKEVLNFVQDNLIKPPITSLKSYHLSEDCTVKGYDGIPLGMFSEVHNGCICSDGSYYRSAYCYAVPRFGKTCSPVSFSDEVPIYYWPSDYSKD